jgi:CheY-like chemotaxis protein
MNRILSGSAISRHHVFILADGAFVVQWGETHVQDLLSGRYRSYEQNDFGHAITDYELNQLKAAGRVEHYNRNYVWLYALPEQGRFNELKTQERSNQRVRSYYLNTTLPKSQFEDVQSCLNANGLGEDFLARVRGDLVVVLGKNGAPFPQLTDAEIAQKQLLAKAPELFRDTAVAFVEATSPTSNVNRPGERSAEGGDLSSLIASQTDTSVTDGKMVVLAGGNDDERLAIRDLLQKMRLEVKEAATANDTLYLLEDCHPDMLVMDLQLPDMHGWAMLGKVKEIDTLRQLTTVVIADHTSASNEQTFALTVAKVNVYLVKPVSMARLRQNVWTAFKESTAS